MVFVKKQAAVVAAARAMNASHAMAANGTKRVDGDQVMQDATADVAGEIARRENGVMDTNGNHQSSQSSASQGDASGSITSSSSQTTSHTSTEAQPSYAIRQAWEHVDEVVQILKTAFPLLILSMETMVDQILQRFKATPEEEIYRFICMLLQDAIQACRATFFAFRSVIDVLQNYVVRTTAHEDDGQLAPHTISNITKMAANLTGASRVGHSLLSKYLFGILNFLRDVERVRGRFPEEQAYAL